MKSLLKARVESGVVVKIEHCGVFVDQQAAEAILPQRVADVECIWVWVAHLGDKSGTLPEGQPEQHLIRQVLLPLGKGIHVAAVSIQSVSKATVWFLT